MTCDWLIVKNQFFFFKCSKPSCYFEGGENLASGAVSASLHTYICIYIYIYIFHLPGLELFFYILWILNNILKYLIIF